MRKGYVVPVATTGFNPTGNGNAVRYGIEDKRGGLVLVGGRYSWPTPEAARQAGESKGYTFPAEKTS